MLMLPLACLSLLLLSAGDCHKLHPRAVIGNRHDRWFDGIVHYTFHSSVSARLQATVREAMNKWEDVTCVQFFESTDEKDYIQFISAPNKEHCTADSIGRQGGQQDIVLGYSCQDVGELLHVLGHVIGLWSEQTRPDRNRFVKVQMNAVDEGQEGNFRIRSDFTVGYEGVGYDFGSIMHLGSRAYSKDGSPTTEVRYTEEYERQGTPKLGQRSELSSGDILRVNRLYHCPGEGPAGILRVEIGNAEQLTILKEPRVTVTAVDTLGREVSLSTTRQPLNRNPIWNEMFKFPIQSPRRWQFFRVALFGGNTPLAMPLTVQVEAGEKSNVHCINNNCNGRLNFNYTFLEDGDECSPNPCQNGGTCTDEFVDFQCACRAGWGGRTCERDDSGDSCDPNPCMHSVRCEDRFFDYNCVCLDGFRGKNCDLLQCTPGFCLRGHTCVPTLAPPGITCNCGDQFEPGPNNLNCGRFRARLQLRVLIRNANVEDRDSFSDSDPYVELWYNGIHRRTATRGGTNNPTWNEFVDFGCQSNINENSRFDLLVWDEDGGFNGDPDRLSGQKGINFGRIFSFPHPDSTDLSPHPGRLYYEVFLSPC